jgi:hypothetical protein
MFMLLEIVKSLKSIHFSLGGWKSTPSVWATLGQGEDGVMASAASLALQPKHNALARKIQEAEKKTINSWPWR